MSAISVAHGGARPPQSTDDFAAVHEEPPRGRDATGSAGRPLRRAGRVHPLKRPAHRRPAHSSVVIPVACRRDVRRVVLIIGLDGEASIDRKPHAFGLAETVRAGLFREFLVEGGDRDAVAALPLAEAPERAVERTRGDAVLVVAGDGAGCGEERPVGIALLAVVPRSPRAPNPEWRAPVRGRREPQPPASSGCRPVRKRACRANPCRSRFSESAHRRAPAAPAARCLHRRREYPAGDCPRRSV